MVNITTKCIKVDIGNTARIYLVSVHYLTYLRIIKQIALCHKIIYKVLHFLDNDDGYVTESKIRSHQ